MATFEKFEDIEAWQKARMLTRSVYVVCRSGSKLKTPNSKLKNRSRQKRMSSATATLRVIPIGGLGEFGMNLMVYEFGESIIVVDCGMMFPDASTLGVDVVIPDMTYLYDRADRVEAIFLTHGHEDHIGAVPFLVAKVNAPVYGSPLTLGFVRDKLIEFQMQDQVELRLLKPRETAEAGAFTVEAIHVTHSIIDAMALAIRTPLGSIIHTGDFKLDQTPIDGVPTDLNRIAAYGEEGVLLLVSDSTNAVYGGFSKSEGVVGTALENAFARTKGRIILTTFASHIHRIQQVIDVARKFRRKVHFVGRSVVDNIATAESLGYVRIPREVRPNSNKIMDERPEDTEVITTGTQGEPTSALARIALNEHKALQLEAGDTVIISARTIPGNERSVSHVIDHLLRRGADVLYDDVTDIHVSGHAFQDELKLMMNIAQPRFFIPMHGSRRHLMRHAQVAEAVGIPKERIFVITNGEVVELDGEAGRVLPDRVPAGKVFIDQQAEEVAEIVVRDRQHLAEDGFVIVVLAVNMNTGAIVRDPEIITRGFVHVDASAEILAEVRDLLLMNLADSPPDELRDPEILQERMRATLKRFFRKRLNRRPMILPVVWEM
jgi:ribonuclease J